GSCVACPGCALQRKDETRSGGFYAWLGAELLFDLADGLDDVFTFGVAGIGQRDVEADGSLRNKSRGDGFEPVEGLGQQRRACHQNNRQRHFTGYERASKRAAATRCDSAPVPERSAASRRYRRYESKQQRRNQSHR